MPNPDGRPCTMKIGDRFGRLTVLERMADGKGSNSRWRCRCECGQETIAFAGNMRRGKTQSCGCLHAELLGSPLTHGETRGDYTSSEYGTWCDMNKRCYNPKSKSYPDYGGRGIWVCDRWRTDFATLLADMGRKPTTAHTIERIDNDGHYEPGNCRWATKGEQALNRRPRAA